MEVDGVDDQRVALPPAGRVAEPLPLVVQADAAGVAVDVDQDHDVVFGPHYRLLWLQALGSDCVAPVEAGDAAFGDR